MVCLLVLVWSAKASLQVPPWSRQLAPITASTGPRGYIHSATPIQAPPPGKVMGASGQGALSETASPAKLPVETCALAKVRGFPPNFHRSPNDTDDHFSSAPPTSELQTLVRPCFRLFGHRHHISPSAAPLYILFSEARPIDWARRWQPRLLSPPTSSNFEHPSTIREPISQDDGARKL